MIDAYERYMIHINIPYNWSSAISMPCQKYKYIEGSSA